MIKQLRKTIILCLVVSLSTALPSTFKELSLEEMIEKAELAFYGVVIATEAIERNNEPWTKVSFELLEPFKGLSEDDVSLELLFYGGSPLDDPALLVSLMPQFETGQTVVIFAYQDTYYSPIVGFRQGLWREQDAAFVSEAGERLSLGEENRLLLEGVGASPTDILQVLREVFGSEE